MAANKNLHLTPDERRIIEQGIKNGATKSSIAQTIGKDKSTVGKEIKNHRVLKHKFRLPLECANYARCAYDRECTRDCPDYKAYYCSRRDRSPGACNGCEKYSFCRFNKFVYDASDAHHEYRTSLVESRLGINATVSEIKQLGEKLLPLLEQGQSLYVILQNHPEIDLCEKTLYNYIENGVFQDAGVPINNLHLKIQVRRKIRKDKKVAYKARRDRTYLKGRTKAEYDAYMKENPNTPVVQMDTVYNNVSDGPFIQTFKFLQYDFLFCIYQDIKDTAHMYNGILLLESILGKELFEKECGVILTDRGSEFSFGDETEIRGDGTRRTRIYYCDPMASGQKGSLENVHLLLRQICPKECNLRTLGLDSQEAANLVSSHINSYPKEKLKGKNSFQLLHFLNPEMAQKFLDFGLSEISPDQVLLKPYLLKK